MTKNKVIIPKVVRGGVAIPIGNNYYYMKGRKHSNGGIDIGNDPKTGLEVESDEIVHMTPKEVKVFSAVPFINGNSPAQLVLGGINPNKVFEIQEKFKDKNNIKDDGTKAKYGVNKNTNKLSDEEYISIMEKVAKDNYKQWGFNNEDEALLHALNDNTYDYRGYYNKYPNSRANAETHWTDEFKTVYHPTFSNESRYSGLKSQFNPNGLIGGYWNIDEFIPAEWQRNRQYKNGGKINNIKNYRTKAKNGIKKTIPIKEIGTQYFDDNTLIADKSGKQLNWKDVLQQNPNYPIYVDENEKPIFNYNEINKIDGTPNINPFQYMNNPNYLKASQGYRDYIKNSSSEMEILNAMSLGLLNRLSLSQNVGVIRDINKYIKRNITANQLAKSIIDGNTGFLSEESYNRDPITGEVINLVGDFSIPSISKIIKIPNINKVNKTINYSKLTNKQWDDLYYKAIDANDMDRVQYLRDTHFKVKAPNTDMIDEYGNLIHEYHGSPETNLTELLSPSDPRMPKSKGTNFKATGEEGIYLSPNRNYASRYTEDIGGRYSVKLTKEQKELLKAGKTREELGLPKPSSGRVYDFYSNTKQVPLDSDLEFNPMTLSHNDRTLIESKGYSGFTLPSTKKPEHVVFDSKQLKLANPITYDDAGKIIPLSKRDNFNISDIRYSYIPILLGISSLTNKENFNLYDIKKLENNKYKYGGKTNNNKNNNMTRIIQIQANGKDRLVFIPSTGRRAERSGAHRTIAAVGTKTDNNNNTSTNKKKLSNAVISDLIGAGANIIGGITSNIINRNMLDSLNEPVKPTPVVASKLKTTVNVNPQLDEIRETSNTIVRDINNNTASSRTALNRIQLGRLSDMINTNKVYSTKENIETELINKDAINRQQVSMRNAEAYDRYLAAKTAFENDIIDKQSENNIGLVSNIVGSIQDVIARNEQRRKESYDRRALAAMSPNSVEYMYNLGLIPEDEYKMYMTGINMNKDSKVSRAIKNDLFAKATTPYKLINNNYTAPKVLKPIEY